jgi:DNA-binding transcriptional MerR regulator
MADPSAKAEGAFRTISEVAAELGLPQHILRYWETRFPQLRPLQRAGNRRYYRPADVALARRINRLLNQEGYTMRGVQQLLAQPEQSQVPTPPAPSAPIPSEDRDVEALVAIRDALTEALASDGASRS